MTLSRSQEEMDTIIYGKRMRGNDFEKQADILGNKWKYAKIQEYYIHI